MLSVRLALHRFNVGNLQYACYSQARLEQKRLHKLQKREAKKKLNEDEISFDNALNVFKHYLMDQHALPIVCSIRFPESYANEIRATKKPLRGQVTLPVPCTQLNTFVVQKTDNDDDDAILDPHVSQSTPNGGTETAKQILLVFADGEDAVLAKALGADIVGGEELLAQIADGKLMFHRCISTRKMFPKVIKIAKHLGPKGLMPSPAKGTVSDDIKSMMTSAQASIKFEADPRLALVHMHVATSDWPIEHIKSNINAFTEAVLKMKPPKLAVSQFIESVNISSPHTPAMHLPNHCFLKPKPISPPSNSSSNPQ